MTRFLFVVAITLLLLVGSEAQTRVDYERVVTRDGVSVVVETGTYYLLPGGHRKDSNTFGYGDPSTGVKISHVVNYVTREVAAINHTMQSIVRRVDETLGAADRAAGPVRALTERERQVSAALLARGKPAFLGSRVVDGLVLEGSLQSISHPHLTEPTSIETWMASNGPSWIPLEITVTDPNSNTVVSTRIVSTGGAVPGDALFIPPSW